VKRREFITLLGGMAVAWSRAARAQQTRKLPSVGILWHAGKAEQEEPYYTWMLEGFASLGYMPNQNVKIEHRFPNEDPEKFKSMAAELVSAKVDVLVGVGVAASAIVKSETTTIPVVFTLAGDPIASKLVESLARPGGNATGLTIVPVELSGKRLELLKELLPRLARMGLLVNPNEPTARGYIAEGETAAAKLGVAQQVVEARTAEEIEPALDAFSRTGVDAVVIGAGGLFYQARKRIPELALARRLAICVWSKETFEAGALMSYGADQQAVMRRTPLYVDKILKGAKPAELPVEQPTKLQFLFNVRVAKALGLEVPTAILLRADEVVE
jgi:putative tryptophan/tyrosine transport system substrate-binding protein